jgi:hypothetical protein
MPRPKDDWRCEQKPSWRYISRAAANEDGYAWNAAKEAIEVFEDNVKKEKLIQWPYAWADLMLGERNKKSLEIADAGDYTMQINRSSLDQGYSVYNKI